MMTTEMRVLALTLALALATGGLLCGGAMAGEAADSGADKIPDADNGPDFTPFDFSLGDWTLTALHDKRGDNNADLLRPPENVPADFIAKTYPTGTFPSEVNAFLLRTPDRLILFDTGYGWTKAGSVGAHLVEYGVEPGDINDIFLTHMHGDHVGGLLDAEDRPVFPNAVVHAAEEEVAYWSAEDKAESPAAKAWAVYGKEGRAETFAAGTEFMPGFTAVTAFGHTPGHTGFLLERGGKKLFVWGDLMHALAAQMAYPEIAIDYDVDPAAAAAMRQFLLKERIVPEGWTVAGMHLRYPGIVNVAAAPDGPGYRFFKRVGIKLEL